MEHYNGNNAYRIRITEREETKLRRRDNPKYEEFVKRKRKTIILTMLAIMSVALLVILRYARISALSNTMQAEHKQLESVMAERANLEIERDRLIDLSAVEKIAVNEYGMQTPTKGQIVYITVSRDDNVELAHARTGNAG